MARLIVPVLVYVALGVAGLVIPNDQTHGPTLEPWWNLVLAAPLVGLPVVGLVLLAKPGRARIGGVAIAAVILGYFFAWREHWDRDCYEGYEIQACGAPDTYLLWAYIASVVVCAIAVGVVIARMVRHRHRHRVSSVP